MANERSQQQQQRQQTSKQQPAQPKGEKAGRSGEGSRSVIPHLKHDIRAKAAARACKRRDSDF